MNHAQTMMELQKAWPCQLLVKFYDRKVNEGKLPRLGLMIGRDVSFGTWVKSRKQGHRIFGFRTVEDMCSFAVRYDLELPK